MCFSEINPCEFSNGGCAHKCHYDQDTVHCTCNEGFYLLEDGKSCEGTIFPFLFFPAEML